MARTYSSEWPIGLLLDEVWLRARRTLVLSLEEAGVWPSANEQRAFLSRQRERGEALRDSLLVGNASEEERQWMVSPSMFGASNRRFRARTPMALAFGYAVSEGLQSLEDGAVDASVAATCGVFNFGISVFDLLYDSQRQHIPAFTACFDRRCLLRLHTEPSSPGALHESARLCQEPEVRLLLRTIATVYERLYSLTDNAGSEAFTYLTSLLSEAHTAELGASSVVDATLDDQVGISRAKSVLPFAIMEAIGGLRRERLCGIATSEVAKDIGTIFWLTDDLADVVGDARSGSLNSLLVRAGNGEETELGSRLISIMDGCLLAEAATAVRDALERVREVFHQVQRRSDPPFDRVLGSYVRMWIE